MHHTNTYKKFKYFDALILSLLELPNQMPRREWVHQIEIIIKCYKIKISSTFVPIFRDVF